jgi:putative effector of murein hydrolase LrgA (UPF0299 family)
MVDRLFILFIALELLAFPLVPFLPFAVAIVALLTRLRHSRWRTIVLWSLATLLTVIVTAPFILGLFDLQFLEVGPPVIQG